MKESTKESWIKDLSSLGCKFALGPSVQPVDPEETIIRALDSFWSDKKIFTMLIGLLKYRLHHLVSTQRLFNKAIKLSADKKLLLIAVSMKVARRTGDDRFKTLAAKLKTKGLVFSNIPAAYTDVYYIQRRGIDKEFKKIGVVVANYFDDQHEKKFLTLSKIYEDNLWLRMRALIGPDYRADVIYLISANLVKNQSAAADIIGCNKSSVSRIWNSIKDINSLVQYTRNTCPAGSKEFRASQALEDTQSSS